MALSVPVSLSAQEPSLQHADSSFEEGKAMASLSLPDAPEPQGASGTSAPQPASSSSSSASSSQQAQPAAKPPCTPAPAAGKASSGTAAAGAQVPTGAPCPTPSAAETHAEAERELKQEEQQRLLGVMPQFQVVMGGAVVPLTPGEKMRLALHSAIDPFYVGYAFVVSGGYGELVDSHPGFGYGPGGYFKRVGAGYADNVNGAIIGNAVLPILLHQDPRYFRLGTGKFIHRFLYAAASTVVCKGDNGKWQPNVSNVLGNFISGAISNAYYPANERGVALTLENGVDVTLYGAVGGQILEFGPDLARLVHHHKKPSAAAAPTPGAGPVAPASTTPAAAPAPATTTP